MEFEEWWTKAGLRLSLDVCSRYEQWGLNEMKYISKLTWATAKQPDNTHTESDERENKNDY